METDDGLGLKHLDIVLHDCLKRMGWRLRAPARRRFAVDIAALCTSLRVAVMIDYAGKMPQLRDDLCVLLALLTKESGSIACLRVMSVDDIGYLIHKNNLNLYMDGTLNRTIPLKVVVLDDDSPRFALPAEEDGVLWHFAGFKTHFLSVLSHYGSKSSGQFATSDTGDVKAELPNAVHGASFCTSSQGSSFENVYQPLIEKRSQKPLLRSSCIDLGGFLNSCEVSLPTLNGWLLGYPVIYLFKKEGISKATCSLSVSSLHLYKLLAESELMTMPSTAEKSRKSKPEVQELTSFTVPSELSSRGVREQWAEAFLTYLKNKINYSQLWKSLELQLTVQICQSVAL